MLCRQTFEMCIFKKTQEAFKNPLYCYFHTQNGEKLAGPKLKLGLT